ncbi:MAG TPA: hypothetical protein VD971_10555 [Phycisphaerales bacterium]|nr:hypothetical protein [Phycisphaerales bacterium]
MRALITYIFGERCPDGQCAFRLRWKRTEIRDAHGEWRRPVSRWPQPNYAIRDIPRLVSNQWTVPELRDAWIRTLVRASLLFILWRLFAEYAMLSRASLAVILLQIAAFLVVQAFFLAGWWKSIKPLIGCMHERRATALLASGLCPVCCYSIDGVPIQPDGCTVCPECSAGWQRADATNTEQSAPSASA